MWRRILPAYRESMCPVKETIRGFKAIIDGEMDEYPEGAFFNVGTIDDVIEKAKSMERKES